MLHAKISVSTEEPDVDAIWQGLVSGLGITNMEMARTLRNVFVLGFSANFMCLESIAKCQDLSESDKSTAIFELRRECQRKLQQAILELQGSTPPTTSRRRPQRGKKRS